MKHLHRAIGLTVALSIFGGFAASAAGACPIPCTYVRNDDPYLYVEVCSPVR